MICSVELMVDVAAELMAMMGISNLWRRQWFY